MVANYFRSNVTFCAKSLSNGPTTNRPTRSVDQLAHVAGTRQPGGSVCLWIASVAAVMSAVSIWHFQRTSVYVCMYACSINATDCDATSKSAADHAWSSCPATGWPVSVSQHQDCDVCRLRQSLDWPRLHQVSSVI